MGIIQYEGPNPEMHVGSLLLCSLQPQWASSPTWQLCLKNASSLYIYWHVSQSGKVFNLASEGRDRTGGGQATLQPPLRAISPSKFDDNSAGVVPIKIPNHCNLHLFCKPSECCIGTTVPLTNTPLLQVTYSYVNVTLLSSPFSSLFSQTPSFLFLLIPPYFTSYFHQMNLPSVLENTSTSLCRPYLPHSMLMHSYEKSEWTFFLFLSEQVFPY